MPDLSKGKKKNAWHLQNKEKKSGLQEQTAKKLEGRLAGRIQTFFLRKHGKVSVRQGKNDGSIGENPNAAGPFYPVRSILEPTVKRHDRHCKTLDSEKVAVKDYAYTSEGKHEIEDCWLLPQALAHENNHRDDKE